VCFEHVLAYEYRGCPGIANLIVVGLVEPELDASLAPELDRVGGC
jgi:hypothetical protein